MFINDKKTSMECEIFEQPQILDNLFKTHVNDNNYILFDIPTDIEKIIFVASGSSYHCARYGADLFGNVANIEARAIYSSEFLLKAAVPHEDNILYVFITQSGETSDTNQALVKAKELGMRTLCITNKKGSTIWKAADFKIDCCAGEEKSIAATKSLTTQMLCVTLLVLKYAAHKGIDIKPYLDNLKILPQKMREALALHKEIKKVAKAISKYKIIVVTADGISYALAKEASLKIKETSYICTLSSILGEFMHGHVAVLNNQKTAQIHIAIENMSETALNNLRKIRDDYKTPLYLIGNSGIEADCALNIECSDSIVKSFCLIGIVQLLALETAQALHRNIDKPHGLHKVVK